MITIITNYDNRFIGDFVIEGTSPDDYETLCSALYDIVGKAISEGFDLAKIREALSYAQKPIYLEEQHCSRLKPLK